MSMKTALAQAGYKLEANNVWSRSEFSGISYSDGDETEERIGQIVAQASDIGLLSTELKQHCIDWPSQYHLSGIRANILRPFQYDFDGADVLEIGAGCGAITRFLGEVNANVLALEGTPRRAAIARSRTRDLPNVEVLSEKFDQFKTDQKFDFITLIGVLEYANQFEPDEPHAEAMVRRARGLLKPGGKLIIAIENQLGLKYFAGAPEDHLGKVMYGIEDRYRTSEPQTFGRKMLAKILERSGFSKTEFLAPFPDYKFPVSVVTERGLNFPGFDAGALAGQSVTLDMQLPSSLMFSPERVWPVIQKNGLILDLANSFLVVAGNEDKDFISPDILGYHFSTSRAAAYCKAAVFKLEKSGAIVVRYKSLSNNPASKISSIIEWNLPAKDTYLLGNLLSESLINIVTTDNWSMEEVGVFLQNYLTSIVALTLPDRDPRASISVDDVLPGECFDLVPQNIIVTSDGSISAIDKEWVLSKGIPVGWLVYRTLLLLVQSVTRFGRTADDFERNRMGFFLSAFRSAGLAATTRQIEAFSRMEAEVQAEVSQLPVELFLNWWSDSPLPGPHLQEAVLDHRQTIDALGSEVHKRDSALSEKDKILSRRSTVIKTLQSMLEQSESRLAAMGSTLSDSHGVVSDFEVQVGNLKSRVHELENGLNALHASSSWKMTEPLRAAITFYRKARSVIEVLPALIERGGGIRRTVIKVLRVAQLEGIEGIRTGLRGYFSDRQTTALTSISETALNLSAAEPFNSIIPYYVDPKWDTLAAPSGFSGTVGVHLHLSAQDLIKEVSGYLNNIPYSYDLFVSVPENAIQGEIESNLRALLATVNQVHVENVPDGADNITALIAQFGERLLGYDVIGHFHTQKSLDSNLFQNGCKNILDKLLGFSGSTGGRLAHLFDLLQRDAKLIYPEGRTEPLKDFAERAVNFEFSKSVAEKHTLLSINDYAGPAFPDGAMFWARKECIRDFLTLPLVYDDFLCRREGDRSVGDAINSLILGLVSQYAGRVLRIHTGDSVKDYRDYEEQKDFSNSIVHSDVKILSYYLPQFHPIAENDEWHGKGFTEWTKVRAANPLFEGHYQQHIPHSDIGYYLLDTPEILRTQAEQMRQAGVYGQVFYHYWFGGKLILEEPAQLLLANPDIQMPFSFCWANENWTRRWDGNDDDILLGQNYSADDAKGFIKYLIPFFSDPRYIKINNRPVLFIYRPASITNVHDYLEIWTRECLAAGIEAPYVVGVITRGATDPRAYGMEAGVERVLHDWTDGAVPELKHTLQPYSPINRSVLHYRDIADFYTAQQDRKEFTYFRSLVPMWDNTARYGSDAYVVHDSRPYLFQEWLEESISYSQATLPDDRRLVLVNAWNEWAEGAHLEPDTRFGYAYLNSVGRALSGIPFTANLNLENQTIAGSRVHISIAPYVVMLLERDVELKKRFYSCLAKSSIFDNCQVSVESEELLSHLPKATLGSDSQDFVLKFRKIALFDGTAIEKMVQTAKSTGAVVIANAYDGNAPLIEITGNGSIHEHDAHSSPMLVTPKNSFQNHHRNFRMRTDARCFVSAPSLPAELHRPAVTTIIRFHKAGSFNELKNALFCLYAMADCVVVPFIATQDLSVDQTRHLKELLDEFSWADGFPPVVQSFNSADGQGDLRSVMLNQSLKLVRTQYAAFLDFDDLVMSHAYHLLISRLELTGKAVSFGRVYQTEYDSGNDHLVARKRGFEYGYSYDDFVNHNHAPLHSFMMDLEQIDLREIKYFEDQRFMEDYLLTLQIFRRDNCVWGDLKQNNYIGDYIHAIDRTHTLALSSDDERDALIESDEYMLCDQRINEIRRLITH